MKHFLFSLFMATLLLSSCHKKKVSEEEKYLEKRETELQSQISDIDKKLADPEADMGLKWSLQEEKELAKSRLSRIQKNTGKEPEKPESEKKKSSH